MIPVSDASSSGQAAGSRNFFLELIGFTDAETSMVRSTFRLTRRRAFCYSEATQPGTRADIYLVNCDKPQALEQLAALRPGVYAPAVLIGRASALAWPRLDRPIHWMRLFEQLDAQMHNALDERARRDAVASSWDGRTFRRSLDRKPEPEVAYLDQTPVESVLVVDDSATVRAFMRAKLAPFRFDVDFAESGEQAIDMAQAKYYSCIFLDILMPGMDGYQVCKRLKASSATRASAVVMLSSKASAFDKFRGSWAGCDAYLGKPVAEDALLATIAEYLPSARRLAQSMLAVASAS
jgi:two-component system, cell cycle response regulator